MATTLGLRTYYTLVVAQTVSLVGSRVSFFAVGVAIFAQTGHATPLAIMSFCQVLPWIVLGGVGGALADRFDRRQLMILANLGFVAASSLLLLSFATHAFRLWHLYALSFATSLISTVSSPAFDASVAMLVPDAHRDRANAISQMAGPAANALAPTLAGLLYALIGVTGAIFVDIATFLVAIAALAWARIPMPARSEKGVTARPVWRQAFDGLAYLGRRPPLLGLGLLSCVTAFVMGALGVLILPYPLARTHSTFVFAVVITLADIGAICGAAAMGAWGGRWRPRMRTVLIGLILSGLLLSLTGVARTMVGMAAAFFAFSFVRPFVGAASASIFQAKVAPDVQGRVFGALSQIAIVVMPISFLIAGPLSDRVAEPAARTADWQAVAWLVGSGSGAGMGLILVIMGLTTAAIGALVYALPAMRGLEAALPDHAAVAEA